MYYCYLNYVSENIIFYYICKMMFEIFEIIEYEYFFWLGLNVNLKCNYFKRYICFCEVKCWFELLVD